MTFKSHQTNVKYSKIMLYLVKNYQILTEMKKILITLMMVLACSIGYSQYYVLDSDLGQNPGGLNNDSEFPQGGGLPAGWTTVKSGAATTWSDVNIPFTFNFNGNDYTKCKVGSGVVTFETSPSAVPGTTPSSLPHADIPDNSVVLWGIEVGTGDFIVSKTFGSAPNRQLWIQFNSAKSAGTQDGWTYWSIVLEETSNNIHVVDQRTACRVGTAQCNGKAQVAIGVQIDNSTAYQVAGSPAVESRSGNDPLVTDNVYYTFYQGVQPDEDLAVTSIDINKNLSKGSVEIKGDLINLGKNAVTGYELYYSIDGGSPVKMDVSGVSIASGSPSVYSHSTNWDANTAGTFDVKVWTAMPNGKTDEKMANDDQTVEVTVYEKVVQRLPLYEIFTSSTCGPCRPGNENFHTVMSGKENECIYIKYQQSWPGTGDPYCTEESNVRRNFYGVNSIPRMELDGEWDQNASSFTSQIHTDYSSRPAFIDIEGTYSVRWDGFVEANITVKPYGNFSDNNTLYVALMEGTTYLNKKSNGESEFTNVMKKMLGGANGTNLGNLTSGTDVTKTVSHDFNGSFTLPPNGSQANWPNLNNVHTIENWDDLLVVMWVQNRNTKEVYQAGRATQMTLSVPELEDDNAVKVYPNPTLGEAQVEFNLSQGSNVSLEVTNSLGQVVKIEELGFVNSGVQTRNLNLTSLENGIYFVKVKTNNASVTKTIVLSK